WTDDDWDAAGRDGRACYIHGVAIRRQYAGLGKRLLAWAEAYAASKGKRFVRLDCWSGNAELNNYYEHLEFREVGVKSGADWSITLREKPIHFQPHKDHE